MLTRFQGENGRAVLVDTLRDHKIVGGDTAIAEAIAEVGELLEVEPGRSIIEQGGADNDVYLILSGSFDIIVNGRALTKRGPTDHVGEMAAVQPTQRRSATVTASETSVVCKIPHAQFLALARQHSEIWRTIAKELARRLEQRNNLVTSARDRIRVFLISSSEALPVANAIQAAFQYDPFLVTLWTHGVFRASRYPIEALEQQLDECDFAIAIVGPDDLVQSRGQSAQVPRDNVIFELGLFIGRLGRKRSILLEPRGEEVKLPSDLTGITTVPYRTATGREMAAAIAPACHEIRQIIEELGPNN